jgi:hypothetical protein
MRSLQAIRSGAAAVSRSKRIGVFLWFVHLVLAALIVAPAGALLASVFGHSKLGSEMLASFDLQWLMEFFHASRGYPVLMEIRIAIVVALVVILVNTFFAGGAISLFASADRYTPRRFLEGCGRYYWRFFRLLLIALIPYCLILAIGAGMSKGADKIWRDGLVAAPLVYAGWVRGAVVLVLFALVNMVFDYAKIRMVTDYSRSAFRATGRSIRFVFSHLGRCAAVWATLFAFGLLLYLAYDRLAALVPKVTMTGIWVMLFLQQLYIVARIWLRLNFWAAQTHLYLGLKPTEETPAEPVPVYAWPPDAPGALTRGAEAPLPPQTEEEAGGPA